MYAARVWREQDATCKLCIALHKQHTRVYPTVKGKDFEYIHAEGTQPGNKNVICILRQALTDCSHVYAADTRV